MAHTFRAMTLHCMDARFLREELLEYLKKIGLYKNTDFGSWAGAGQPLLSSVDVEFVMKQIGLSKKLHSITEVHIIQHVDCGAYGGSAVFEDIEKERAFQVDEIKKAKAVINEQFPELKVVGHLEEQRGDTITYVQVDV